MKTFFLNVLLFIVGVAILYLIFAFVLWDIFWVNPNTCSSVDRAMFIIMIIVIVFPLSFSGAAVLDSLW